MTKDIPSEKLFDEILKQGVGYIDDAIKNKMVENYYLDFKESEEKDYSSKRSLLPSDKKNYSKAISTFGNSDGGVIVWGVKTGPADNDYATAKAPIKNVSNFISLLESFTSLVTSPPHPSVSNKIIYGDEKNDTGYAITYIAKSNRRPFQVLNDDFRYYIRAGSSSLPAPDTFLRSLFGQEPQPDVFIAFGVAPVKVDEQNTIKMQVGIMVHNRGENVGKNINGYVHVGGRDMALQAETTNEFTYYKNNISGLKLGFTAKSSFILGIEQEVQPVVMHINIKKPITENGIQIITLVNCDGQASYRMHKEISRENLENIYDSYIADRAYDIVTAILGKDNNNV